jgi:hypothetical protein
MCDLAFDGLLSSMNLELHPLAKIFPPLAHEELVALAEDLKLRGQREPVILFQGKILDGQNRYLAAKLAGLKDLRIKQFDPKAAGCTPAQFVVSQNLRRRHLSIGQMAAVALQWADELEKEGGLPPVTDENGAKQAGRPKSVLAEAARKLGINEQRAYELRQIRGVDAGLYGEVRAGTRSLNDALWKILSGPERQISAKGQDALSGENIRVAKRRKRAGTKADNAAMEPARTNPTASNRNMELSAETFAINKINKLNAQSTLNDLSCLAHRLKRSFQVDLDRCIICVALK